jgi:hypothetical protein
MSEDDEKRETIIERIRKLSQRTVANGCTEAEAKSAAAVLDRLLELYEIDLSEIQISQGEVVRIDIALDSHPVRWAAKSIATFADAKVWVDKGNICFLALEVDAEICEYLLMMFMRAIDREAANFTMMNVDYALRDRAGQGEMLHSFKAGIASRLGERLLELKSKRDFTAKAGGRDLVVLKKPVVDAAFATLGITLGGRSVGRSVRDQSAYVAGRSAAENVSINAGVRGSNGQAGRIK